MYLIVIIFLIKILKIIGFILFILNTSMIYKIMAIVSKDIMNLAYFIHVMKFQISSIYKKQKLYFNYINYIDWYYDPLLYSS